MGKKYKKIQKHTINVIELCRKIADDLKEEKIEVNEELLYCSALYHDVAKLHGDNKKIIVRGK